MIPWIRIAIAAAAVALLAAGYTILTGHHYRRGYNTAYTEVNEARLAQIAAAQAETDEWKTKAQEAEHAHAKLQAEINRLAAVNADRRADIARLRRDLDAARAARVSAAAGAACPDAAAALDDVFGECAARVERLAGGYAALADAADRHAADTKRLIEAWPTATPRP